MDALDRIERSGQEKRNQFWVVPFSKLYVSILVGTHEYFDFG